MAAPGRNPEAPAPHNFRDWITHYFGDGISSQFMAPYNLKLWRYSLEEMGVDGIAPFVPIPTVEDVRRGATPEGARGLGYNPTFFYPERGGIYSLILAMAQGIKNISLRQRAVEVDTVRRTVSFDTGYTAWYDTLISTMPLPELINIIKDVPDEIREAARRLRYVSVYDINLGVARAGVSPYHWLYFPGPEFPFYRVGFLDNFSPNMAPPGSSALYVEVSHLPDDEQTDHETLASSAIEGLVRCGILTPDDTVPVSDVVDMKYAYVVFDAHRTKWLPVIMEYLRGRGILSIGRYGAWEYSSMEDAIIEGRAAAEAIGK